MVSGIVVLSHEILLNGKVLPSRVGPVITAWRALVRWVHEKFNISVLCGIRMCAAKLGHPRAFDIARRAAGEPVRVWTVGDQ